MTTAKTVIATARAILTLRALLYKTLLSSVVLGITLRVVRIVSVIRIIIEIIPIIILIVVSIVVIVLVLIWNGGRIISDVVVIYVVGIVIVIVSIVIIIFVLILIRFVMPSFVPACDLHFRRLAKDVVRFYVRPWLLGPHRVVEQSSDFNVTRATDVAREGRVVRRIFV